MKNLVKVKVYAERTSGSAYLEWLLVNNLYVELQNGPILGWKRRVAPDPDEIPPLAAQEVLFVCLVKNPYSWVQSLHRKPSKHEELSKLPLKDFIRLSFGDYRNPLTMWNIKAKSYFQLRDSVKRCCILRYEDLLSNPRKEIDKLAENYQIPSKSMSFRDTDRRVDENLTQGSRAFHRSYYLKEHWREKLTNADIGFINQSLDLALMKDLDYKLLPHISKMETSLPELTESCLQN